MPAPHHNGMYHRECLTRPDATEDTMKMEDQDERKMMIDDDG